jgi:GTP-binding protein Era
MISKKKTSVRSGYITLLGLPNAGKSSFLNTLIGEELAIVTPKPQTTWKALQGYLVTQDIEAVITDTPGIQTSGAGSTKALNQTINQNALEALTETLKSDGEIIALMIDSSKAQYADELFEHLKTKLEKQGVSVPFKTRILPTINKADLIKAKDRKDVEDAVMQLANKLSTCVENPIWVSSKTKEGFAPWVHTIKHLLPSLPSGSLFDPEDLSDKSVRAFCEDYIREQCFMSLQQEMPYSVAVEILQFNEKDLAITRIEAELHVERESQKRMVVGKGGTVLKKIGMGARIKAEKFLKKKVYLGLHVKVTPNWTKNTATIKKFGYSL